MKNDTNENGHEKLPPVKQVTPGVYRHYKGKEYAVHMTIRHSETLEDLAFYECLYENENGQFWVRPVEHFSDYKELNGKKVKRFELIEEFKEEEGCECCHDDENCNCEGKDECKCDCKGCEDGCKCEESDKCDVNCECNCENGDCKCTCRCDFEKVCYCGRHGECQCDHEEGHSHDHNHGEHDHTHNKENDGK